MLIIGLSFAFPLFLYVRETRQSLQRLRFPGSS